jgi:hypothetical protein
MVASGFCTTWMNTILGLLFGAVGSPYTAPGTLYFGLCTAVAADGTVTGEPATGNYSRKSITNDTSLWNTAANGALDNKAAITFATANGSWGALDTFFIADHATLGGTHIIAYGTLTVEKTITSGDTPSFGAGDLDISLTATT